MHSENIHFVCRSDNIHYSSTVARLITFFVKLQIQYSVIMDIVVRCPLYMLAVKLLSRFFVLVSLSDFPHTIINAEIHF